MLPVASWSPDDYYRASRHANRAWLATQPQQVLPGVLEKADEISGVLAKHPRGNLTIEEARAIIDPGALGEGDTEATTSLVVSPSPSALEAAEHGAFSRHEDEGCYSVPDSQLSVGLTERKGMGTHSDGLAPFPDSAASSAPLDRTPCPGDALDTTTREETC